MEEYPVYTNEQVNEIACRAARMALAQVSPQQNLENRTGLSPEGDDPMKRIKQQVTINGTTHWLTGYTMQDILTSYLQLCLSNGVVAAPSIQPTPEANPIPLFGPYIENFNRMYKSGQQSLTRESRSLVTRKHILPRWGDVPIDRIRVSDLQAWFSELEAHGYAHETMLKIKNNMSPVFDSAIEDGYIQRNPIKSSRLKIGGRATIHHKAIPKEKMEVVRAGIPGIRDQRVRYMAAFLANTGMRFEEVLGLRWEDIHDGWIYIERAVVHPKRNMPEVKPPKSESSERRIPFPKTLKEQVGTMQDVGFILSTDGGITPLSFTQARRCFEKIKQEFGLDGFTAHDFRDTCATEWREAGISVDVISRLLGHSKTDITENRYVKYRDEIYQGVRDFMDAPKKTPDLTKSMV